MALVLNGSQYLTIADAAALTLTKPFTLSWWQLCDSPSTWRGVMSYKSAGSDLFRVYMRHATSTPTWSQKDLAAIITDSSGNNITWTFTVAADYGETVPGNDTTWRHVALTMSHLGSLNWWVDGVRCASLSNAAFTVCDGDTFYIGRDNVGSYNWLGQIAEVAKWDRTLIPQEIESLYAGAPPSDHFTGLAWWLPLLADKEPGVGSLTVTNEGSATFTPTGHPVTYNSLTYYNGIGGWQVRPTAEDVSPFAVPASPSMTFSTSACRNQYVPMSFCLRASAAGTVAVTQVGTSHVEVDPHYVKRWIQNANYTAAQKQAGLMPELLLKNPALISTNVDGITNDLADPFVDSETLQTIALTAGETQQYWFILHVPKYTSPGSYILTFRVTRDGTTCFDFTATITVQSFGLELPSLIYHIFDPVSFTTLGSAAYAARMIDMALHGISDPMTYEDFTVAFPAPDGIGSGAAKIAGDAAKANIATILTQRAAAGMPNTSYFIYLFSVGCTGGTPWWDAIEAPPYTEWKARAAYAVTWLKAQCSTIEDVYFFGGDDLSAANMTTLLPVHQALIDSGGKVIPVCMGNYADALSTLGIAGEMPMFNTAYPYTGLSIAAWTAIGNEVMLYGTSYDERPAQHRQRFGLEPLYFGYGGISQWAYQSIQGTSQYDDMDSTTYKDMNYVYDSDDRLIKTVQYEGLREAIVDARYAATLVAYGGTVPDPTDLDLDTVRSSMIDSINANIALGKVPYDRVGLVLKG